MLSDAGVCRISLVPCGLQQSVLDTASAAAIGFCSLRMKRHVAMLQLLLPSTQCDVASRGCWSVLVICTSDA